MITIEQKINVLLQLKQYIQNNNNEAWVLAKQQANAQNAWFTLEHIELALTNICHAFLNEEALQGFVRKYNVPATNPQLKKVGIVMAGNIPLVGFHDFLCCFLSGHIAVIKPSAKDAVLIKHLVQTLIGFNQDIANYVVFEETLKGCHAYIATGSNNSGNYFEYYFGKYPHIIRKNRTSVAVLTGNETPDELNCLAKDIMYYYGQGCRNVTAVFVPQDYSFEPLVAALQPYEYYLDLHKYKHNFDYQLTVLLMNNKPHINAGAIIITPNDNLFAPISQLNYSYYTSIDEVTNKIVDAREQIQCVVGKQYIPFGDAQKPSLTQFADGVDTMQFLMGI